MNTEIQNTTSMPPQSATAMSGGEDLKLREKQSSQQPGTFQGTYFEPAVDIYETPHELTLVADIPGTDADHIHTELRDNLLTITAEVVRTDSKWRPLHQEFRQGHFLRQFRMGQHIDQSKISAEFKDGVLTLHLPKSDIAKPRRIQVQMAG